MWRKKVASHLLTISKCNVLQFIHCRCEILVQLHTCQWCLKMTMLHVFKSKWMDVLFPWKCKVFTVNPHGTNSVIMEASWRRENSRNGTLSISTIRPIWCEHGIRQCSISAPYPSMHWTEGRERVQHSHTHITLSHHMQYCRVVYLQNPGWCVLLSSWGERWLLER